MSDPEKPSELDSDPRARRARFILLWLTVILIVLPFAVWFMVGQGAPKQP